VAQFCATRHTQIGWLEEMAMTKRATATFEVKKWDEQPYFEGDGQSRLTRASVAKVFRGDLEGESTLEYLMAYPGDGTASFVGLERVTGHVAGRAGSFILQHTGSDDGHTATGTWRVVPGSGTGELRGLSGQGRMSLSRNEPQYTFTLDYELP
jgi:hypothetical protein